MFHARKSPFPTHHFPIIRTQIIPGYPQTFKRLRCWRSSVAFIHHALGSSLAALISTRSPTKKSSWKLMESPTGTVHKRKVLKKKLPKSLKSYYVVENHLYHLSFFLGFLDHDWSWVYIIFRLMHDSYPINIVWTSHNISNLKILLWQMAVLNRHIIEQNGQFPIAMLNCWSVVHPRTWCWLSRLGSDSAKCLNILKPFSS